MKSANEWSQQTAVNGNPPDVSEWWVQQIQLDALREGMRRAAIKVKQYSVKGTHSDMCAEAIITAAEQLTESDL